MPRSRWLSPLRYPGAQRRLVPYIRSAIHYNDVEPTLFIEPFAGGASVAIQLLGEGTVEQIGLADKDKLVSAFWKVVFSEPEWLIDRVQEVEPSLELWKALKTQVADGQLDLYQRAFACLYLNRTSFSGILHPHAGPLGGYEQDSEHDIACRFSKDNIIDRIRRLGNLRNRVAFVWNKSWRGSITLIGDMQSRGSISDDVFYYLDPPFFNKSEKLYQHSFGSSDHAQLRNQLTLLDDNWLLSYDDCEKVWQYYGGLGLTGGSLSFVYGPKSNGTVAKGGRTPYTQTILTNLRSLPSEVVLWTKSDRRGVARME